MNNQISEATIEKISKAGAEIVLDIVTGWRRDPIPFSKEEAAYKIAKRIREIIQGEGLEIEIQSREELVEQIWEVHIALIRAGEHPNKYPTHADAIRALAKRKISEGEGSRGPLEELLDYIDSRSEGSPGISFIDADKFFRLIDNVRAALEEGEPGSA